MGRMATVFGILLVGRGGVRRGAFNNIMDMLQLVFAFVNAPLFATFLLGMFWKRTTGHGAFWGLSRARSPPRCTTGSRCRQGRVAGVKGGFLRRRCTPIRARWRRTSGRRSSRGRPASS
jgi:SSS family solute:Na+ symporter